MKILNATQHVATPEQVAQGVVDPPSEVHNSIKSMLTFHDIPTKESREEAGNKFASLVANRGFTTAMIGGAPYFMGTLERSLKAHGVTPVYAFSTRVSVERVAEDGTVTKVNEFRHLGFVEV